MSCLDFKAGWCMIHEILSEFAQCFFRRVVRLYFQALCSGKISPLPLDVAIENWTHTMHEAVSPG